MCEDADMTNRLFRRSARALAALLAMVAAPAQALDAPEISVTERATVQLKLDHDVVAPGGEATLLLYKELAPEWHTYWRNPGDSGLETTIRWTAPEGVEIGEIQWPAPHRIPLPPLMNYGYDYESTLLAPMQVSETWPAGAPIELTAEADWLVCADVCIPESQTFTLSIPTAADAVENDGVAGLVRKGRAKLPTPLDAPARAQIDGEEIVLRIEAPELAVGELEDVYFFPAQNMAVKHAGPQRAQRIEDGLELRLPKGDAELGSAMPGVLRATDRSGGGETELTLALTAQVGDAAPEGGASGADVASDAAPIADIGLGLAPSLAAAALLAMMGGAILNLMPCVFPVLALKALSISKQAHEARGEQIRHAAYYGAGVLLSFLALAGALLALKSAGAAIGWGFQLQTPIVIAALAYVMFVVGLNLAGLFELPGGLGNVGGGLAARGGASGSFFTGVLAVIVASPCTAPFMGAALGYAVTQDAVTALLVFAALGIGFAAPLVALSLSPRLARALPRPGPWMVRLRQALAFPMFLTAAWLLWVLGNQLGVDALFAALIGVTLLGFAAWALGAGYPEGRASRRVAAVAGVAALLGAGYALTPSLGAPHEAGGRMETADGLGEPFSPSRLEALRGEGRQVFLNVTADWCISCKFNERVVLTGEAFETALSETNTAYMVGDWTKRDAEITALLESFGRVGVPLYVVYPADGGAPEVLPQLLSEDIVADAFEG